MTSSLPPEAAARKTPGGLVPVEGHLYRACIKLDISDLLDGLPGASKKVMTDTLRALERDGLVTRQAFAEVPVRVEYSLTPLGWSMTEPLMALSEWGSAHAAEINRARYRYSLAAAHSPAAA